MKKAGYSHTEFTGVCCGLVELIDSLPPGSRVLDLGARTGSFQTARTDITVIRLDLEVLPGRIAGLYCASDAARLPFAAGSFAAVISNHSLEHFMELDAVLREIGRVMAPGGSLYVAVPDAGTLADGIYRWLGRGGGHVNPFRSAEEVARLVEERTGLRLRSACTLYASLSFLNAYNFTARPPRKIALFGFGNERFLAALVWILRQIGGSWSRYGWSFYFGAFVPSHVEEWVNVCVRCGSGHSEMYLRKQRATPQAPRAITPYRCPVCGGFNLLTRE